MSRVNELRDVQPEEQRAGADDALWCNLRQVHLIVMRGLDGALQSSHHLPLGEYELLRALAHPGCAQRMAGLASAVGLSPSGLTRAIERLERRGLVSRVACQEDRRGAMVELTRAGTTLLHDASITFEATLQRRLLDHVSDAEAAQISRFFGRLIERDAAGHPTGEECQTATQPPMWDGCADIHAGSERNHPDT